MNILYLSPVHPLLAPGDPLPMWQTQMSHVRALMDLGHEVTVMTYTPNDHIRVTPVERVLYNAKILFSICKSFESNVISSESLSREIQRSDTTNSYHFGTSDAPSLDPSTALGMTGNKHVDVLFLSFGADVLLPETMRFIKHILHAPLVILSGVSPIHDGNPRERAMAPLADLVTTNDLSHAHEWDTLGAKKTIVLPISATDQKLYKGPAFLRKGRALRNIDVLFAGTVTPEREQFFQKFRKLLGRGISFVVKHHVFEDEYVQLLSRAKIVLNPLRPEMERGANLRLFEIPACGGLQLASHTSPEWFADGKEIVTYKSADDAARLVTYYLSHEKERERIAFAGQQRVLNEHTFKKRFEKLIDLLYET